jgi:tetratricopeptide (TPR) repeat protein
VPSFDQVELRSAQDQADADTTRPQTALGPALITEEIRVLDTYPFSEPNPVPILGRDARLYPYHTFEGYSVTSQPQEWKVVKLENDWLEVFVLPEVGGKVWGAVVKETGHEFIYRNEVMKFRNIALRGPWTSGGIEFNFGVIGHTPSTATPVDYKLVENPDGSVSCWVGAMDLPSRTHWRVELRLPADRTYFETNVLWYNPTPLTQPYYNWMTAAAFAQNDLQMAMPGNAYLQHSGQVEDWPTDEEGRYLPTYANNTFGGPKSYHVVGELHDFFGGYFSEDDYGFGHWARHEDMPGQKLWLWALSREGGVWEDLLTDTDGQYVEFQAGRLFVQYSPGSHVNPITEARFDPVSASRWSETWFPVEGIGGLTEASRDGAMSVSVEGGQLTVAVNAFRAIEDTLRVWADGETILEEPVTLEPLAPFETSVEVEPETDFRVQLAGLGLDYASDPSSRRLSRPFVTDDEAWPSIPGVDRRTFEANELMKGRRYARAREVFEEVLEAEAWNREALLGLGELAYRRGLFEEGLEHVNRVLQLDAYDAEANFLAGLHYRTLARPADAQDAFGWAARSTAFRTAAYVQLAELKIIEAQPLGWWRLADRARAGGVDVDPEEFRYASVGGAHLSSSAWSEAIRYARLALESDRLSVPAWQALATIGRWTEDAELVREARAELMAQDPLHHFVAAEEYLEAPGGGTREAAARRALEAFGGEYPDQAILELAIRYANLSMYRDALLTLNLGAAAGFGAGPVQRAWGAMMDDGPARLLDPPPPDFAFPYRAESLPVLRWAAENSDHWIWDYLLALNLWALDREEEAAEIMDRLSQALDFAQEPTFAPAWVARALLLEKVTGAPPVPDLQRAVAADPESRILHLYLIRALETAGWWEEAIEALDRATERFASTDDFDLDLLRAKALINLGRPIEATGILNDTHVLPSEGARESHRLWQQAHTMAALDAYDAGDFPTAKGHLERGMEWPENLGQGRPYEPEERLPRFILGHVEARLGNPGAAEAIRTLQPQVEAMAERATNEVERALIGRALRLGQGNN